LLTNIAMKQISSTTTGAAGHPLKSPDFSAILGDAQELLRRQAATLKDMADGLGASFPIAVTTILARPGRVVVCGMGKSGLIGRKIAATLSSTGTPAFFLHASEALHGDLGMVTPEDTVLMISHSGETDEVLRLLPALRDMGVPVIGMAGNPNSTLARKANVVLDISVESEACPLNLAPTTSTLVTLALGDALAVTLSQMRGFQAGDFARCHPGGALGRRLCTRVEDVMRTENLPIVRPEQAMRDVVMTMTEGRCGTAIVLDGDQLRGVITDGDLRRAFQKHNDCMSMRASDVMTSAPVVIRQDATLADAEELMRTRRIKVLVAVNQSGKVRGVVEIYS
jgi:arabinose-5-phosphate isomerase